MVIQSARSSQKNAISEPAPRKRAQAAPDRKRASSTAAAERRTFAERLVREHLGEWDPTADGEGRRWLDWLREARDGFRESLLVKVWAENGGSMDMDDYGETASWIALRRPNTDLLLALISHGADPSRRNRSEEGATLLMQAIRTRRPDAAEALIQAGADVHAANDRGEQAIHCVDSYDMPDRRASERALAALAAAGADLDALDGRGMSLAMQKTRQGYPGILAMLIEAGCDLEREGKDGQRALHFASGWLLKNLECLRALIAAGADLEAADAKGFTPLLRAASLRDYEFLRVLAEAGADSQARTGEGLSMGEVAKAAAKERGCSDAQCAACAAKCERVVLGAAAKAPEGSAAPRSRRL